MQIVGGVFAVWLIGMLLVLAFNRGAAIFSGDSDE